MYNPTDFQDIAPFDDSEFKEKMAQLVVEPGFEHAVRYVMPDVDFPEFVKNLLAIPNKESFQINVMRPFLELLEKQTTAGVTMTQFSRLDREVSYTYISNHRDIVLDASFLNLALIRNRMKTSEVAIGNNLLIMEWITDLVKLNKSFIVKRNLGIKQALEAARQLSAYIHYAITQKGESVWIAQREGRAKDSNDVTQDSLIKMMSLAGGGSIIENLKQINLCPVSISYEYDPNDYLKAREFLLKKRDPAFKKSQRDDLFSMETGILGYKGKVNFEIGGCINGELDKIDPSLDKAETIRKVCDVIDCEIHGGYQIFPVNYIAYDRVNNSEEYVKRYTPEDVKRFEEYVEAQVARVEIDDPSEEDLAFMRDKMYQMYANPLKNKLKAIGCDVK